MTNSIEAVDDSITATNGNWRFDRQVTQVFDSHVIKSVPLYEEIQRMVVEISEYFIRDNSTVYDIGSSTGTTLLSMCQQHSSKKNINLFGIEESPSMIESARSKCSYPNVNFILQDVTDHNICFENASFVTSILTMQFIPFNHRLNVLRRIYGGLVEGGALIMVEKTRCENSFFESPWLELYWDFKERQGLTDSMIRQKSKSLRGILNPLTLQQNLELLSESGFSDIEIFFKWYNFSGLIAVKGRLI
ncbi:methylase involved in ubiquinone/menaquinone biosynthesis (plasmid) [Cylindrospermum stagnale PCC 7417]|uniref:Carboxy-S-adenosyl-L-methionine synthase n=1 Tax=Cylindrospermum stagnale PCC 7417 TaxID=56107 RepID=K9X703_9NOST|nr:methyltransferase domain-containing protein [Cylindrospermum stagnale]AFZ28268.1 methylase involved in ubiquinone/menaquinone biosynthesis [Cylindrospermum stagnale PCC 7417]